MIRREGDFIRTNLLITAQVRLRPKFKKWDIFGILNGKSGSQMPASHFSAERQGFEPITLTAYATMSYIPKFQIGNETVTIFRRWACPTLTAVCLPNFRVQR